MVGWLFIKFFHHAKADRNWVITKNVAFVLQWFFPLYQGLVNSFNTLKKEGLPLSDLLIQNSLLVNLPSLAASNAVKILASGDLRAATHNTATINTNTPALEALMNHAADVGGDPLLYKVSLDRLKALQDQGKGDLDMCAMLD